MLDDFARTLSLLRQEKKISQRKASASLGVSQALLSHYENGVREPGLPFVVKASQYYGVSCDYLLGRSMSREGGLIDPDSLIDISEQKDNVLKGSAFVMLNKKLIVNSTSVLMDVIARCGNKKLAQAVCGFFAAAFYKAFRLVYDCDSSNKQDEFPISNRVFSEKCDIEMKAHEMALRQVAEEGMELSMSPAKLAQEYNALAPSLFSMLHNVSEKISEKN